MYLSSEDKTSLRAIYKARAELNKAWSNREDDTKQLATLSKFTENDIALLFSGKLQTKLYAGVITDQHFLYALLIKTRSPILHALRVKFTQLLIQNKIDKQNVIKIIKEGDISKIKLLIPTQINYNKELENYTIPIIRTLFYLTFKEEIPQLDSTNNK